MKFGGFARIFDGYFRAFLECVRDVLPGLCTPREREHPQCKYNCGVHTTNLLYFLYAGSNLFMLYLFYNGLQRIVFKQNLQII